MPQGNPLSLLLSVLAGAGFKNVTKGIADLASSGQDITSIFSLPNFPLLLAGAGLRDSANSMETFGPLVKSMMPPAPPQNQPDPQKTAAAMQMLSARLGGGLSGIQAPMGGGMPGGMGGGMPPRPGGF